MMEEIPDPTIAILLNKREDVARLTPEGCSFTSGANGKTRKVAIIGAGPAGLCAARHLFAPGSGFTGYVYELSGDIGGTWLYSDATGKDRFGLPIHSILYYDLWTNLPKETMAFPGFEYKDEERSYLPASSVLQYLVSYADHYKLHPHIKLHHHITRVAPVGNSWSVSVVELTTQVEHVSMFDAVVVCSGPNIIPVYPQVDGLARFSGQQLHSKQYRKASAFEGKRVLIIGLGPSGIDISFALIPVAKQVIISHNKPSLQGVTLPSKVLIKPIVSSMQDKTIKFSDGTEEEVDVIIHCTGYTYHYPFLTPECGLIVDQYVTPLYKHFINIERPNMCIIGIPRKCPHMYMLDYQVRSFLKYLKGEAVLPSKEVMLGEIEEDRAKRTAEGQRKKDFHQMSTVRVEEYFKQIAEFGKLEPIPPVILKIFSEAFRTAIKDFVNFRKTNYIILDDENFTKNSSVSSTIGVKFSDDQQKSSQETENANIGAKNEDTNVEVPGEDTNVEVSGEDTNVEVSGEDTNVEVPGEDNNVEVSGEDTNVEVSAEDTNVEVSGEGTNVEVSAEDTNAEVSGEGTNVEVSAGDTNEGSTEKKSQPDMQDVVDKVETNGEKTRNHVDIEISTKIPQKENGAKFIVEAVVEKKPHKEEHKIKDSDDSENTLPNGDERNR